MTHYGSYNPINLYILTYVRCLSFVTKFTSLGHRETSYFSIKSMYKTQFKELIDQQWKEFLFASKSNIFISGHIYLEVYKIAFSFREVKTKERIFEDIWQDLRGWFFFRRRHIHLLCSLQEKGDTTKREGERERGLIMLKLIINDGCLCITFHRRKEMSRWFDPHFYPMERRLRCLMRLMKQHP
jgi:hypothetical protein